MYEFRPDDAYDFARHVGIQAKPKGKELQFLTCPYCRGGQSRKDKGTFAISLETGQFHCLRDSCGVKGNMLALSADFDFSLGTNVDEYYKPKKRYKSLPQPKKEIDTTPEAIKYLVGRGISEETIRKYEITTHKDHSNALVFPFFDDKGTLVSIKYRKTDFDKNKDSCKEWFHKQTKPILFGMKQCEDFTTLTITEGQVDSLSVAEAGIKNAVSVPTGAKGFTWLPYCWDWINQFQEIIVFGDHEKGHITLLDDLAKRLKMTIKHVREEDYKDCKDANEILQKYGKEQIRHCIDNAKTLPINRIVDLADVKTVDEDKVEKLHTSVNELDKALRGGIPLGGVTLVSGKAGAGKSTFASQLVVQGLSQGYRSFVYSGELRNEMFKKWFNFQIAGRDRITEYSNRWGDTLYKLSERNNEAISEWYRDRCFIYDSEDIEGEELTGLCELVENVIKQYGTQIVLIDNLMTALDLENISGSDKYDRQGKFVKKLARIALRHNVLILLVVHKRKNNYSTNENDEVAGSSDISNLATTVITYEKDNNIRDDQRLCKLTKNRLYGFTNTSGILLDYDEKSKRVFEHGHTEKQDFKFGWDNALDVRDNEEINTENPFEC